jgi:hypothetical protein
MQYEKHLHAIEALPAAYTLALKEEKMLGGVPAPSFVEDHESVLLFDGRSISDAVHNVMPTG